jgi:hypothetical protein
MWVNINIESRNQMLQCQKQTLMLNTYLNVKMLKTKCKNVESV